MIFSEHLIAVLHYLFIFVLYLFILLHILLDLVTELLHFRDYLAQNIEVWVDHEVAESDLGACKVNCVSIAKHAYVVS